MNRDQWAISAHEPYSFVIHDSRTGLDVWRNNVTGYFEDWPCGDSPLKNGSYAKEADNER